MELRGLAYEQDAKVYRSQQFDFRPLKSALDAYVNGYKAWSETRNASEIKAAWMAIGQAQRDVPAHVAHEYCRLGRSSDVSPKFNQSVLARSLSVYNKTTKASESWFPLQSPASGLGYDFAVILRKDCRTTATASAPLGSVLAFDLAAVTRLDEQRTAEQRLIKERFSPSMFAQCSLM